MNTTYFSQIKNQKALELFDSNSFVDVLQYRAKHNGDSTAFTLIHNPDRDDYSITFSHIDRRARAIAVQLLNDHPEGSRIILSHTDNEEFIVSLFACFYAKMIAVPVARPYSDKDWEKIKNILKDCQARMIMIGTADKNIFIEWIENNTAKGEMEIMLTDSVQYAGAENWVKPDVMRDEIALLQYTSGSTGNPKGVMITHGNLLHNELAIQEATQINEKSVSVCWLPLFHDMGLVGFLFQTFYSGSMCVLMPTASFIRQPFRWLNAISEYRACNSGGPNFAYELLCKRKLTEKQKKSLDLSCWTTAANGSEPVRAKTLEDFVAKFSPYGFSESTFINAYGSAECTLYIASGPFDEAPRIQHVNAEELQKGKIKPDPESSEDSLALVSCGQPIPGQLAEIIDPGNMLPCPDGQVGEIWLHGQGTSISPGYWGNLGATREVFQATLPGKKGFYFRTGDLGAQHNDQLYVTGREKDLVIVNGMNHYPQDIEHSLDQIGMPLRAGSVAVFSTDTNAGEALVVVQEIKNPNIGQEKIDEAFSQIKHQVFKQHQLAVDGIALIAPKTIDKTSSGKIQRRLTRQKFLDKKLELVDQFLNQKLQDYFLLHQNKKIDSKKSGQSTDSSILSQWFSDWIEKHMGISKNTIDHRRSFAEYGMDSMDAELAAMDLTAWLGGPKIETSLFWEFQNIEALAMFLSGDQKHNQASS